MSVKPDNDEFMFRIIEEGRACYVTHLLNLDWTLDKVLPMNRFDLDQAVENEDELMLFAYKELSKETEKTILYTSAKPMINDMLFLAYVVRIGLM